MMIIGLTGSIGMGKSTVAAMFEEEGAPSFNSDTAVHGLYAPGGAAVAPVEAAFPGVTGAGGIDRAALSSRVVGNPGEIKRLEAIVHPLVRQAQMMFLRQHRDAGVEFVVLDIPLLFEGDGAKFVDKTVVVSAPADVQRARVLARPGMTPEKFEAILALQMPDAEKRARADFVIDTAVSLEETRAQVRGVLDALRKQV
ncbi:MAG: dephospho-CoA kinase [Hyphomonadaceae bacterium]|nr:dephospho-CoA kinase [Hyphomonadaceae bacterium]